MASLTTALIHDTFLLIISSRIVLLSFHQPFCFVVLACPSARILFMPKSTEYARRSITSIKAFVFSLEVLEGVHICNAEVLRTCFDSVFLRENLPYNLGSSHNKLVGMPATV